MKAENKKATALTAAHKKIIRSNKYYRQEQNKSIEYSWAERIRKHRENIPIIHRKIYDRAMQGKSLKSAVKGFCLECVCWQKEEVRFCTSITCPLYPYRPYKQKEKQASEGPGFIAESTNSGKGDH